MLTPGRLPELKIELREWQKKVISDPARFQVVDGGRRIGKTDLAMKYLLIRLLTSPRNSVVWYINRYRKQAKEHAWRELKRLLAYPNDYLLEGEPNENELMIPLLGGRILYLHGTDEPASLRGAGLVAVASDEHAWHKEHTWWDEVVRPALSDKGGRALILSTPRGRNHFYGLYRNGIEEKPGWKSFRLKTADCEAVPPDEIEQLRREMAPDAFAQEYEGEFLGYVGLAAHEFLNRTYPEGNILPFSMWIDIMPKVTFYGGLDWARSSGSTLYLKWGADPEGRMFFCDELVMPGGSPQRAAGRINSRQTARNKHQFVVSGRDTFSEESMGFSAASQLHQHGIPLVRCPARLEDAVARINDLCMPADPADGKPGLPRFMVVSGTCPMLVSQLITLQTEDLDKKTQSRKDAFDVARMAVMMGLRGSAPLEKGADHDRLRIPGAETDDVHPVSGRPL